MVQSVELLLDDDAEAKIRRQWQLLADAGLPSPRAAHRPHVTVAVAREIWPRIDKNLEQKVDFAPLPIRIGAPMIFGGRRAILVRLVVPTEPLLSLHRHVHELVADCPGLARHTGPGEWTPHMTLARRLSLDQLGPALTAILDEPDFACTAVGIRRWDGDNRREWRIA